MDKLGGLLASGMAVAEVVPVDDVVHPDAAVAMAFWRDRKADGIHIGRDVPSRAVARLLSRVVVCRPTDDGDFRVHLAGGTINQRFQRDITGERVSELFSDPTDRTACLDGVNAAIATGQPHLVRVTRRAARVELLRNETVVLPATAPNGKDRWALVFAFYF